MNDDKDGDKKVTSDAPSSSRVRALPSKKRHRVSIAEPAQENEPRKKRFVANARPAYLKKIHGDKKYVPIYLRNDQVYDTPRVRGMMKEKNEGKHSGEKSDCSVSNEKNAWKALYGEGIKKTRQGDKTPKLSPPSTSKTTTLPPPSSYGRRSKSDHAKVKRLSMPPASTRSKTDIEKRIHGDHLTPSSNPVPSCNRVLRNRPHRLDFKRSSKVGTRTPSLATAPRSSRNHATSQRKSEINMTNQEEETPKTRPTRLSGKSLKARAEQLGIIKKKDKPESARPRAVVSRKRSLSDHNTDSNTKKVKLQQGETQKTKTKVEDKQSISKRVSNRGTSQKSSEGSQENYKRRETPVWAASSNASASTQNRQPSSVKGGLGIPKRRSTYEPPSAPGKFKRGHKERTLPSSKRMLSLPQRNTIEKKDILFSDVKKKNLCGSARKNLSGLFEGVDEENEENYEAPKSPWMKQPLGPPRLKTPTPKKSRFSASQIKTADPGSEDTRVASSAGEDQTVKPTCINEVEEKSKDQTTCMHHPGKGISIVNKSPIKESTEEVVEETTAVELEKSTSGLHMGDGEIESSVEEGVVEERKQEPTDSTADASPTENEKNGTIDETVLDEATVSTALEEVEEVSKEANLEPNLEKAGKEQSSSIHIEEEDQNSNTDETKKPALDSVVEEIPSTDRDSTEQPDKHAIEETEVDGQTNLLIEDTSMVVDQKALIEDFLEEAEPPVPDASVKYNEEHNNLNEASVDNPQEVSIENSAKQMKEDEVENCEQVLEIVDSNSSEGQMQIDTVGEPNRSKQDAGLDKELDNSSGDEIMKDIPAPSPAEKEIEEMDVEEDVMHATELEKMETEKPEVEIVMEDVSNVEEKQISTEETKRDKLTIEIHFDGLNIAQFDEVPKPATDIEESEAEAGEMKLEPETMSNEEDAAKELENSGKIRPLSVKETMLAPRSNRFAVLAEVDDDVDTISEDEMELPKEEEIENKLPEQEDKIEQVVAKGEAGKTRTERKRGKKNMGKAIEIKKQTARKNQNQGKSKRQGKTKVKSKAKTHGKGGKTKSKKGKAKGKKRK